MKKNLIWWCLFGTTAWALFGCHASIRSQQVDTEEIPKGIYNVTIHQGYPKHYAVLFDNLHDETRVVMMHTWFTRAVGTDRPDEYLERFRKRIKFYSTFRISGEDGIVRGYLVLSDLLGHIVYKDRTGNKIVVRIIDPHLRARTPP